MPKNVVEKKGIQYDKFANQEVQKKRHWKAFSLSNIKSEQLQGRYYIHSLVPLYFTPKTPTLSAVREIQKNIFFVQINPEIICSEEIHFCFTDGNAASTGTKHYTDLNDMSKLSWDIIHATYWNKYEDGSRIRNSEVLIHPVVSQKFINKIVVSNEVNLNIINKILQMNNLEIPCEINLNYFF